MLRLKNKCLLGRTSPTAVLHNADYDRAEVEDLACFGGDEVQRHIRRFHQLLRHGFSFVAKRALLFLGDQIWETMHQVWGLQ